MLKRVIYYCVISGAFTSVGLAQTSSTPQYLSPIQNKTTPAATVVEYSPNGGEAEADAPLADESLVPPTVDAVQDQPTDTRLPLIESPYTKAMTSPGSDLCSPINGCDATGCEEKGCGLFSDDPLLKSLKNQEMGPFTYSMGGSLRYRYIDESNRLRPPLNGRNADYQQWRFTPYFELKYGDDFTGYVEAIDASTFGSELPLTPIDENRADLLQFYGDLKLIEFDNGGKLRVRVGRQFLKYGSQHLISPLAWSNTYRTFEGIKLYYDDADWAIDGFCVAPGNDAAQGVIRHPTSADQADYNTLFSGVYATYKKAPKGTLDLYWLWLNEQNDPVDRVNGNRHTIGLRYAGKEKLEGSTTLSWDAEGAYQFGKDDFITGLDQDISAGFVNFDMALTFDEATWTPTVRGVYFWGSGDNDPTDGTNNTVSTLFPLGHAYWGQIDNFSGQNLTDYSLQFSVKPTKKLTLNADWHLFEKSAEQDAIYNVAGAPYGGVSTTDSNLGNEIDLLATYKVNKNLTLQGGYFMFFYGDAVTQNSNAMVANRADADQFYFLADWAF